MTPNDKGTARLTFYKLLRKRKNGTLGSLFINRKLVIPIGEWVESAGYPTKGYAYRPGWHCSVNKAPHLSLKDRVWCLVEAEDYYYHKRPVSQGGLWAIAKRIKILKEI